MYKRRKYKGRSGGRGRGSSGPGNVIKVNPLGLIFGNVPIFYERRITDNMSGVLGVSMLMGSVESIGIEYKYSGFGISPELRFYFAGEAPRGFFAALGGTANFYTETVNFTDPFGIDPPEEYINQLTAFGGGVIAGYQWIIGDVFVIDLFGGANYLSVSYTYDEDFAEGLFTGGLSFEGVMPRLGASIGLAF